VVDGPLVIEDSSPCPTQARVSCALLRGAGVDSYRTVKYRGIDPGSPQPDPPEH